MADIWRVVISGTVLGQKCQNVLHFSSVTGAQNATNVRDIVLAQWVAEVRNVQNSGFVYSQIDVQQMGSPPGPIFNFPVSGSTGALSGEPAPTFCAGLYSIRSIFGGPDGHGRFYLPGLHRESILNGVLQSGAFAAFVNVANNLTVRFRQTGTQPITLGVTSRNDPVGDFKAMTSVIARQILGVQRRRNIGVGG